MDLLPGKAYVSTVNNGGHPPEFWADRAADKICQISDNAAPHIKEQAYAFKNQVRNVILHYMREAIKSDRGTVNHLLTEAGHPELGAAIRRA